MDDIINLIKESQYQDDFGVWRDITESRPVFAQIRSASSSEFFAGGRIGLNPEYEFIICASDYDGETVCEYHGQSYAIYRKFHRPGTDYLELYVERKGGTNGKVSS